MSGNNGVDGVSPADDPERNSSLSLPHHRFIRLNNANRRQLERHATRPAHNAVKIPKQAS